MHISQATMKDYDGIVALHRAYHTDFIRPEDRPDGFVTTSFTPEQLKALITEQRGVTVAKDDAGKVMAYATAASWDFWAQWPLFTHMIGQLPLYSLNGRTLSVETSYQYGPACLDKAVRGTGLFAQLFHASLAGMKDRYPVMVTFINQINHRSYAAHTKKVFLTQLGTFQFNQNNYYFMACETDAKETSSL
ncbi:GNAT family acetyltransferase [Oscillibacter sp.]|uniref:GNAT family N-acetyltransferase n=1 Tax=Oscillibacter sp. TaxID=1945593 RepID=UPI0028A02427|nr:GNAT family acetyltransferase [Oscillibacter sp.]